MAKEVYVFSGLGADESVFQKLDFSGFSTTFIQWVVPQKNESIEHYAGRIIDQITTPNPVLIGLSFGGLMAVEVAKQIAAEKIILIASAKTRQEIPFYYRMIGACKLHKLLSPVFLKRSNFITNWFFGTTSPFEEQLLKRILIDTDPVFLTWAIDKITRWSNRTQLKNSIHIHGTRDRILPFAFVKCDITIENGGHLMTLNKSNELSEILKQQLQ
jgi:hypothetical protein